MDPLQLGLLEPLQFPGSRDSSVYGLRFNVFSGSNDTVVGFDLGPGFNRAKRVFGLQLGAVNMVQSDYRDPAFVGLQLGGVNMAAGDSFGIQTALLANFSGGFVPLQIAGLANVNLYQPYGHVLFPYSTGSQVALLWNRAFDAHGFQISLGYNRSQSMHGIQVGAMNYSDKGVRGSQLGLAYNYAHEPRGLQLSGLINIANSVSGAQVALLLNGTRSFRGVQIAGLWNGSDKESVGLQLAGGFNTHFRYEPFRGVQIALMSNYAGSLTGLQVSALNFGKQIRGVQLGIYNQTDRMRGVQVGAVNYAKDLYGVQFGLVNVIRNGPVPVMILMNANFRDSPAELEARRNRNFDG